MVMMGVKENGWCWCCKNSQPSSWLVVGAIGEGTSTDTTLAIPQRKVREILTLNTLSQYKCHLMVIQESSSSGLSHHYQSGARSVDNTSVHHTGTWPLVIALPTGQRYLQSWKGSPTAPMPHLFTTTFWCNGKRTNHLFSPLGLEPRLYTLLW